MNYDMNKIYTIFEQYKNSKEFSEYFDEIIDNRRILSDNPFKAQKAQQQISKLTIKYQREFNLIATMYGNDMWVTSLPVQKTPHQIFFELQYINNNIPLVALIREIGAEPLKKLAGFTS